ncbi:MAG: hypothetical protein WDN08_15900 [Rhizomicrobium sp.]
MRRWLGDAEHDELVSLFYGAAAGETPWPAMLDRLASLFGSSATLLGLHRPNSMQVLAMESHNYSAAFLREFFQSEIYANDPRIPFLNRVRCGEVYYDENLYDVGEMERDPWVRASIHALKMFDQVGAKLRLPCGGSVTVGLLRTRAEGRISMEAVDSLRRLVPQMTLACALGSVVARETATRLALLDVLASKSDGLVLLDDAGAALFVNDAARQILQSGDGLALRDGVFVTRRGPETRKLQRMIARTLENFRRPGRGGGGRMLVSRASRRRPYAVSVASPPDREPFLASRSAACVVLVQDLAVGPAAAKDSLRALFGLTGREADLCVELVRCADLEQAAACCGMAVNTARTHLRAIFRKSEVASQAEAIQLFGRIR